MGAECWAEVLGDCAGGTSRERIAKSDALCRRGIRTVRRLEKGDDLWL